MLMSEVLPDSQNNRWSVWCMLALANINAHDDNEPTVPKSCHPCNFFFHVYLANVVSSYHTAQVCLQILLCIHICIQRNTRKCVLMRGGGRQWTCPWYTKKVAYLLNHFIAPHSMPKPYACWISLLVLNLVSPSYSPSPMRKYHR